MHRTQNTSGGQGGKRCGVGPPFSTFTWVLGPELKSPGLYTGVLTHRAVWPVLSPVYSSLFKVHLLELFRLHVSLTRAISIFTVGRCCLGTPPASVLTFSGLGITALAQSAVPSLPECHS